MVLYKNDDAMVVKKKTSPTLYLKQVYELRVGIPEIWTKRRGLQSKKDKTV